MPPGLNIRVDHGDGYNLFQPFEFSKNDCAMRPGTGMRNIQEVTICLGLKSTITRWAGLAICRYPASEFGILADEGTVFISR